MKKIHNYIQTAVVSCMTFMVMGTGFTGCKKSIDIGPPTTSINSANIYTSNTTAASAVSGLFAKMSGGGMYNGTVGSPVSVSIQQGLAADEFIYFNSTAGTATMFYTNSLNSQSSYYWPEIFTELFVCNSAIAGLTSPQAASLTPAIQQQLLGEVKFARAFIFFNAVNLYGDVPLTLSTDPQVTSVISRSPADTVLKQVIQDLTDAQSLLPDNTYLSLAGVAVTDRTLPNKQAASALLARVYLYMQDWKDAEAQASDVISASSYLLEPVLTNVFLRTSHETIWSLQSTSVTVGNSDAFALVMTAVPNGTTNNFGLSNSLVSAFDSGDNRLTNWVGQLQSGDTTYYYAYKYKQNAAASSAASIKEYPVLFRLAEQYLIRAEARAQQNDISGAQADLNAIRNRAGLGNTTAATQADLLTAVYHERQIELFTEFGHRWFDLKRTGRLDAVMGVAAPLKGGSWSSYEALLPIPQSEISLDPHLTQTPGYN